MDLSPQARIINPSAAHTLKSLTQVHRINFLDALCFIAAGAVLFQHAVERQGGQGMEIAGVLSPGVFGVVLFFIVSGFVIPFSVKGRFDVRKFALRRFFRIYPLVIVTFSLLAIIGYAINIPGLEQVRTASFRDWVANLLLVQDYVNAVPLWGVTWTLSLEVAWYILFAFPLLFLGKRFDEFLSIAAPAGMIMLGIISIFLDHRLPLGRVGMIYAAILGCRVYRNSTHEVTLKRLLIDAGVFIMAMTVCNVISFGYFKHPNITMNQSVYPWITAPILFLLFRNVRGVRQSKIVNSSIIGSLGAISFSTYLLHSFAIFLAVAYAPSEFSLVVSIVLTLAGYRLVELPGQELGKRIIKVYFEIAPKK
jgi:peptidoglycan/LPS O-acetylase OafA/YrhL